MDILTIAFFWIMFSVIVGVAASSRKRFGIGWFFLAILISPLLAGLLVLALGPLKIAGPARWPCPFCAEQILPAAKVCPNCQRDLAADWSVVQRQEATKLANLVGDPVQQDGVVLEGIRRKVTKSVTNGTPSETVTYVFGGSEYPTLQEAKDAKENRKMRIASSPWY